jgi:hypothetical protein
VTVRAELVRTIIETLASPDLDAYERACDEASPEEMSAAAHELAAAAVRHAAATVTCMDLSVRQISALGGAVWTVLSRWDLSRQPDRKLGDCLKFCPPSTSPPSSERWSSAAWRSWPTMTTATRRRSRARDAAPGRCSRS